MIDKREYQPGIDLLNHGSSYGNEHFGAVIYFTPQQVQDPRVHSIVRPSPDSPSPTLRELIDGSNRRSPELLHLTARKFGYCEIE